MTTGAGVPRLHHHTHRRLLTETAGQVHRTGARLDAVVVLSSREPDRVDHAAAVARRLRCPLVAVCGGPDVDAARMSGVVARVEETAPGLAAYALKADDWTYPLPAAAATVHPASPKQRRVSRGRNMGLLVARLAGWSRILLLDDDIVDLDLDVTGRVVRTIHDSGLAAVGWACRQYPDNSVVCHAYRLAGNPQHSFVGAGSLLIRVDHLTPHFPAVYDEDWFFLFDLLREGCVGRAGYVLQLPFDPYADPQRAADEEFGDVVAEGLFHLLHPEGVMQVRGKVDRAMTDIAFWESELAFRRSFIVDSLRRLEELADEDPPRKDEYRRAGRSLDAALQASRLIDPGTVVAFVEGWRTDADEWRSMMENRHPLGSLVAALDVLHVAYETTRDQWTV